MCEEHAMLNLSGHVIWLVGVFIRGEVSFKMQLHTQVI